MREYLNRFPDLTRITLPVAPPPSQEALEAEEWLRAAAHPLIGPRPLRTAAPSDFTARVMERIEAPAPPPVALHSRQQPLREALRSLGLVGGVVGFSGLLVLASLFVAFLVAPAALITLLNALVGAFVAAFVLLTPLLDAAVALAANSTLMLGLAVLVAGFAVIWSRTLSPSAPPASEA